MTDLESLRAFAQFVLSDCTETVSDQWELQDKAVELGLLQEVHVTEPCAEKCECAEIGFPTICYRKTELLMGEKEP